jgi:hypothetical protein
MRWFLLGSKGCPIDQNKGLIVAFQFWTYRIDLAISVATSGYQIVFSQYLKMMTNGAIIIPEPFRKLMCVQLLTPDGFNDPSSRIATSRAQNEIVQKTFHGLGRK